MTAWASPRDVYPNSVHDLMSLWGDFSTAPNSDGGLEKRFEVDFSGEVHPDLLSVDEIELLLAPADQCLVDHSSEAGVLALVFNQALVVYSPRRLIISTDSSVHLHKVIAPLMKTLAEKQIEVEWASFCRKNIHSPWDDTDTSDIMALEYAELKAAFEAGQSFLSGPIDGDHFFHFIYDNIPRENSTAPHAEEDVQLNAYFYQTKGEKDDVVSAKDQQRIEILPEGFYAINKYFCETHCATFETNAPSAIHSKTKVESLLRQHDPDRFTVIFFEDKDAAKQNYGEVFLFDDYTLKNKTVNHFGQGYAFHQLVFEKRD